MLGISKPLAILKSAITILYKDFVCLKILQLTAHVTTMHFVGLLVAFYGSIHIEFVLGDIPPTSSTSYFLMPLCCQRCSLRTPQLRILECLFKKIKSTFVQ